jgi:hypothetical protein
MPTNRSPVPASTTCPHLLAPRHDHRGSRSALERFSREVDTGSREESASKQESRASVLIQSEPKF